MAAEAKAEKVKLMASTLQEREEQRTKYDDGSEVRKRRHSSSSSSDGSADSRPRKRTHEEMARD